VNQGNYSKDFCSQGCSKPIELIAGICLFTVAAAGGAVSNAASASQALLLILSLVYIRSWPRFWHQLRPDERLLLLGFVFYFFSAVIACINVEDQNEYLKHLGKYSRFLLIVPVYLLLSRPDLKLFKYLLAGAVLSGPLYLSIAFISLSEHPGLPAHGDYHHITFGDMAMLNAMFLTTVLILMKTSRLMKIILMISTGCLLYSSILSTARGAWVAMPVCLLVILVIAIRRGKVKFRTILMAGLVLAVALALSPAKEIIMNRANEAADNIEMFQSGENQWSSVGSRIAMWYVSIKVWEKHPIIGTGPGDYDLEFETFQSEGLYTKNFVHSSTHNIYFQALATTGMLGFVILCLAVFVLPFRFFYKANQNKLNVAAVSGMVALAAFAVFGLTESWTLRAPVISTFLLYFVMLATTAAKEADPEL
jgi:O-antigen ligase